MAGWLLACLFERLSPKHEPLRKIGWENPSAVTASEGRLPYADMPHDLRHPTASRALGGFQHQDPIWISVAVVARRCEVLSAGVTKRRACDRRQGIVGGIEPTGVREASHLRHIDCDRRANGTKGQYQ